MSIRLNKVIKECNVGLQTVVDFLKQKGFEVQASLSERITDEQYELLKKEFGADKNLRNAAEKLIQDRQKEKKPVVKEVKPQPEEIKTTIPENMRPQIVTKGHIDLNAKPATPQAPAAPKVEEPKEEVKKEEPKQEAPAK